MVCIKDKWIWMNIDLLSTTLYLQFHFLCLFFFQFLDFSCKDLQFLCFLFAFILNNYTVIRKKWFSLCFLIVLSNQIVDCPSMSVVLLFHIFFSFSLVFSKWILYILQELLNKQTIFWSITSVCGWTWCAFKQSLVNLPATIVSSFWFNLKINKTICMTADSFGYFS